MATEEGIVKENLGDLALVVTTRSGACASCSARDMCHSMGQDSNSDTEVVVSNPIGAKVGDRIQLSFETGSMVKAMFLIYIVPILCLLTGALIGQWGSAGFAVNPSVPAAVIGFVFFGAAMVFVRIKGNQMGRRNKYRPRIVRVLRKDAQKGDVENDVPDEPCQAAASGGGG